MLLEKNFELRGRQKIKDGGITLLMAIVNYALPVRASARVSDCVFMALFYGRCGCRVVLGYSRRWNFRSLAMEMPNVFV